MVTGENGPNGPPAPKPVEMELIQDPGNVTILLPQMEEKNVKGIGWNLGRSVS